jgi:riboflavin kinase / FMN adenylyltransferase
MHCIMQLVEGLEALNNLSYQKPVLALGNFDGVHLGHQAIFRHAVARAHEIEGTSMVFTFEPHPLRVLAPEKAPPLLTTFTQKMRLIAALSIDIGIWVAFSETFARQQPIDFIHEVLCQSIGVHDLIVGYDFRFGHRRTGTTTLLQEQATIYGYQVTVVPPITQEDIVVSSSNIRHLLHEGQVASAARLLGRPYSIEGEVVEGYRRGATLGFPTANVRSVNDIVPRTGVYAIRVVWKEQTYSGVANIGYNPTFGNQVLSVEAHLFDFSANLYGEIVHIEFIARIRDERKFTSVAELAAQIAHDAQQARSIHAEQS